MQHVIAYSGLSDSKADTYLSEHDITASQVNEWRTQAENALDGKFAGDSDDPIRDIRALLNQVQKEQTQTQKFIDDIANMASRSR
ncbi:hypothetical protein SALB1_3502 [Salinisphaera sp. LB1]|nr:hypothetical protein SALB1_3502 [Salinisphaera sp. LB1]